MMGGEETMLFPGTVQDLTCGTQLDTIKSIFYIVNISCIVILVIHEPYNQQQLYTTSLSCFQHRLSGVAVFFGAPGIIKHNGHP